MAAAPAAQEVAPVARQADPAAGADVPAEVHRVAAHPRGLHMPDRPVRRHRPRILEMHRERRMHRPAIRVAAAAVGADAAAAVRPAARPYLNGRAILRGLLKAPGIVRAQRVR